MADRVLVCGGRTFNDANLVNVTLNLLNPRVLINGGAPGADRLARMWAGYRCIPTFTFPADWERKGRSAGPLRNQAMIDIGKPDLVIAFAGGSGTADMVRRARKAGIEVREVPASVDRNPEGQDPKGLGAQHERAVRASADAQPSMHEIEAEISRLQTGAVR